MKRDRILVKKEMIPYRFSIALNTTTYILEFRYNSEADLFTVGLYDRNMNYICSEPVIYGSELFAAHYKPQIYPAMRIVPIDESGESSEVTYGNFNETVFLTIDNAG